MQSSISVPPFLPRQRHQSFSQTNIPVRPRFVPITAEIHSHQLADPALAHLEPFAGERHVLPHAGKLRRLLDYRLQNFPVQAVIGHQMLRVPVLIFQPFQLLPADLKILSFNWSKLARTSMDPPPSPRR
jgi:hypothetical protein